MAMEPIEFDFPARAKTERHEIEVDISGDFVSFYAGNPRDAAHDAVEVMLTTDMAIMVAKALVGAAHRIRAKRKGKE